MHSPCSIKIGARCLIGRRRLRKDFSVRLEEQISVGDSTVFCGSCLWSVAREAWIGGFVTEFITSNGDGSTSVSVWPIGCKGSNTGSSTIASSKLGGFTIAEGPLKLVDVVGSEIPDWSSAQGRGEWHSIGLDK